MGEKAALAWIKKAACLLTSEQKQGRFLFHSALRQSRGNTLQCRVLKYLFNKEYIQIQLSKMTQEKKSILELQDQADNTNFVSLISF